MSGRYCDNCHEEPFFGMDECEGCGEENGCELCYVDGLCRACRDSGVEGRPPMTVEETA